jgi:hypothetical protein
MTVEQLKNALNGMDMNADTFEGRMGDCEITVTRTSIKIGGMTITSKFK